MTEHIVRVRVSSDVEVARKLGPPPPEGDTVRYVVMSPLERVWFDVCSWWRMQSVGWRFGLLLRGDLKRLRRSFR